MKRTLISMLMIASFINAINAQLIVGDNGHVAVGIRLLSQVTIIVMII